MLSYQHIYHAGNPADVHKHALLCWMLDYLTSKPKPLSYLETHAGRGLYDLTSAAALKTGEASAGIVVAENDGWFPTDHPYMQALAHVRTQKGNVYAGSPALATALLRAGDGIDLAELHPQEYRALLENMITAGARCHLQDGIEMALSKCPPTPRRGLIMIDPSYEVKTEYAALPQFIAKLHRKWNVGVIVLWYPILKSNLHVPMLKALEAQTLPKTFRHEVSFPPVRDGHRMIGSGMFIVNAPFGTNEEGVRMSTLFRNTI